MDYYDIERIARKYVLDELSDDEMNYILSSVIPEDYEKIVAAIQKISPNRN